MSSSGTRASVFSSHISPPLNHPVQSNPVSNPDQRRSIQRTDVTQQQEETRIQPRKKEKKESTTTHSRTNSPPGTQYIQPSQETRHGTQKASFPSAPTHDATAQNGLYLKLKVKKRQRELRRQPGKKKHPLSSSMLIRQKMEKGGREETHARDSCMHELLEDLLAWPFPAWRRGEQQVAGQSK